MRTTRSLARHVPADVPEQRIARQWARISERAARRPARRWVWAAAGTMAVAAASLLLLVRPPGEGVLEEGTVVESAGGPSSLLLPDESRVELGRGAALELRRASAGAVAVELRRGHARFDVVRRPQRTFTVTAGGHDVVVIGTRFGVEVGDDPARALLRVEVERGEVEVRSHDGGGLVRRLKGGERWEMTTTRATAEPVAEEPPGRPRLERAVRRVRSEAPSLDARALLERANVARQEGRIADAAGDYDVLRRRFPTDPRAALAAFELARLRMDRLGDPTGAVEALRSAIRLSPGASFREDAEARLVEAFDALGDGARCRAARDAYLARFPSGAHAAAVARRCGQP